jgi:hypothetical protein
LILPLLLLTAMTVVGAVARFRPGDFPWDAQALSAIVSGDLLAMCAFAMMLLGAFHWRRDPATHWRLVLLASVVFIDPALARIGGSLRLVVPVESPAILIIGTPALGKILLLAACVVHDRRALRRLHWTTGWGGALVMLVTAAGAPLGLSSAGQGLMDLMR